jgi:uncharacterized membrane protein
LTGLTNLTDVARRLSARTTTHRYWEIDSLRGVAIVMMVIYHLMWDLWYFRVLPDVVLYAGFWKYFQRTTASLFITLVGVSLAVTAMRLRGPNGDGPVPFRKFLLRGLRIFGWGMVISLVVWAANVGYVHFGVLHLIGFSIVAAYPFLRFRWLNLALWALFNIAGYFLMPVHMEFPWLLWLRQEPFAYYSNLVLAVVDIVLLWLGLEPAAYYPNDYFPVIPWFGVVLLGIFIGNSLYTPHGRAFSLPDLSGWLPIRVLQWLGAHSLTIYLVHQPLLFALLVVTGVIRL